MIFLLPLSNLPDGLKTLITYVVGLGLMFALYTVMMIIGLCIANFIEKIQKGDDENEK